jgi:hypothetical protein
MLPPEDIPRAGRLSLDAELSHRTPRAATPREKVHVSIARRIEEYNQEEEGPYRFEFDDL